jgi:hypothetical protein
MPSWARRPPKLFYLGMGGGVVGGVGSGLIWHVIDPPRITFIMIEAVLLAVVMVLAIPHSPQTPNLNLIPIIH